MASDSTPRISPNSLANLRPPWKPGESGNPGGKPRRKPLTDALELELTPEVCKIIAQRMVEKAKEASVPHFSEVADRVEGRVIQTKELTGSDGDVIRVVVEYIGLTNTPPAETT
jgi:hypothetical protein